MKQILTLTIFLLLTQLVFSHPFYKSKVAKRGMVSTQDDYATEVGLNILKQGGNAIDAAVAVGYTLAVTHPRAGNIAGGGFMLIYKKDEDKVYTLDFREKAPRQAHKDLFIDTFGHVDYVKARKSALSVGVPGTVAGLEEAYRKFGQYPRKRLFDDAIKLAKKGFIVDQNQEQIFSKDTIKHWLSKNPEFRRIFFKPNGTHYKEGEKIIQTDLAKTLRLIQQHGKKGFYEGKTAEKIIHYMKHYGGIISESDLRGYAPVWREPIKGMFHDFEIYSMPPPSSGGVILIELFNILDSFNLEGLKHNSTDYVHIVTEAMKFAYADRARYLGDTDFVDVPVERLTSKSYAEKLAKQIDLDRVIDVATIYPKQVLPSKESMDTTHFSIVDPSGNIVSCTYTLNWTFGNGMIVEDTGIILNNQMDDFSAKPGSANTYGLIGNAQNEIQPEKRMLSSMTPTIVFKNGVPFIVTGTPGGSTIITTILQQLLNIMLYDMDIVDASYQPRFHHQWYPDVIMMEPHFPKTVLTELKNRGFLIKTRLLGVTQTIIIEDKLQGFSDHRYESSLTKGY